MLGSELAAVPVLIERVGVLRSLQLGARLAAAKATGSPFRDLPPATDDRERASRAQIGPAIVLYRALLETMPQDEALALAGDVIEAGAMKFLKTTLGPIVGDSLDSSSQAQRESLARETVDKFFNASVGRLEVGPDALEFTVDACRFPELCEAVGVPELAPAFCRADARYFGEVEKRVELVRPTTIASGGASCPFALRRVAGA